MDKPRRSATKVNYKVDVDCSDDEDFIVTTKKSTKSKRNSIETSKASENLSDIPTKCTPTRRLSVEQKFQKDLELALKISSAKEDTGIPEKQKLKNITVIEPTICTSVSSKRERKKVNFKEVSDDSDCWSDDEFKGWHSRNHDSSPSPQKKRSKVVSRKVSEVMSQHDVRHNMKENEDKRTLTALPKREKLPCLVISPIKNTEVVKSAVELGNINGIENPLMSEESDNSLQHSQNVTEETRSPKMKRQRLISDNPSKNIQKQNDVIQIDTEKHVLIPAKENVPSLLNSPAESVRSSLAESNHTVESFVPEIKSQISSTKRKNSTKVQNNPKLPSPSVPTPGLVKSPFRSPMQTSVEPVIKQPKHPAQKIGLRLGLSRRVSTKSLHPSASNS